MDAPELPQNTELSRLERLPMELLAVIFDRAFVAKGESSVPKLREPLSKRLLPFIRRNLFHSLHLADMQELSRFLDDTRSAPEIRGMIVDLSTGSLNKSEDPVKDEQTLFDFFHSATALQTLATSGRSNLLESLLSVRTAAFGLSSLRELKITNLKFSHTKSLAQQFRNLRLLPNLKILTLRQTHFLPGCEMEPERVKEDELLYRVFELQGRDVPRHSAVERLDVEIFMIPSAPLLADFLAQFSSTTELAIRYAEREELPATFMSSVLQAVVNPALVTILKIYSGYGSTPQRLDLILPRFAGLVGFGTDYDHCADALSRVLCKLPNLEDVKFASITWEEGDVIELNVEAIKTILRWPFIPPALNTLDLPFPRHRLGHSHDGPYYRPTYDRATGRAVPDSRWYLPCWPETFTREQATEIVELAKEAGISLYGELKEALNEHDEYEREVEWCNNQPLVRLRDL